MRFSSEYCAEKILDAGFKAFYAYKTAREMLLYRDPQEIHIVTTADLSQLSRLFPDLEFRTDRPEHAFLRYSGLPVYFFVSDYPTNSVRIPGILEAIGELFEKALEPVLFTVNSFFFDLEADKFYDPLGSFKELKNGCINTIHTPSNAAKSDPLLALKTAKLFSDTGFTIERNLMSFLKKQPGLDAHNTINLEISDAIQEILVSRYSYEAMVLLDEWGVLDVLLPEVTRLKKVEHDKDHHPEGNAFRHTLRCLKFVKKKDKNLMMAVLLHDTGKANTYSRGNDRSFPNHAGEGREIARTVLRRFKFNNRDTEEILFLVENHMIIGGIHSLPEKRRREIFSSQYFPLLLELYRADIESGFHAMHDYYNVAKMYRSFIRKFSKTTVG
jgi:tRNA nucleotidyltransferase/poly(A) polymerase